LLAEQAHFLPPSFPSIHGYLDLLAEGEAGELTDEQRQFLSIAARNTDRLRQLVEHLLLGGVGGLAGSRIVEFNAGFAGVGRSGVESKPRPTEVIIAPRSGAELRSVSGGGGNRTRARFQPTRTCFWS
jgi:hypothetical protein